MNTKVHNITSMTDLLVIDVYMTDIHMITDCMMGLNKISVITDQIFGQHKIMVTIDSTLIPHIRKVQLIKSNTEVIKINNKDVNALIDSGSGISSITYEFYNYYLHNIPLRPITDIFPEGVSNTSATDHELNISGFVDLKVIFPGLVHPIPILFTVLKGIPYSDF